MNFITADSNSSEIPHERQAVNRYRQFKKRHLTLRHFILLTTFLPTLLFGQQDTLKSITPEFSCVSDSIVYYILQDKQAIKTDTIVVTNYSTIHTAGYENRNYKDAKSIYYIFTKMNKTTQIKIIDGCKKLILDTSYIINDTEIFDFYFANKLVDINKPIKSWLYRTHDDGYFTEVYINGDRRFEVGIGNSQFVAKPNEIKDKRVTWTELIRKKIK